MRVLFTVIVKIVVPTWLLLIGTLLAAEKEPSAEKFYRQAERAIVRLTGKEVDLPNNRTIYHSGTGFFVRTANKNVYIVTAAHVVASQIPFQVTLLLDLDNGKTAEARMVLPHDKWEVHPDKGDTDHLGVDVVAMKVKVLGGGVRFFSYCPQSCPPDEYNQLDDDPEPPDTVMVFGFPDAKGMRVSRPLGRQGMVAFVDHLNDTISVASKWFDRKGFLIDSPTIVAGTSGGPVIRIPPFGKLTLVGLLSASNSNLGAGYAIASSASRIRELIDRLEAQGRNPVDPWCLTSDAEAKKITSNTIPVCVE
jgi:hypothetical protein